MLFRSLPRARLSRGLLFPVRRAIDEHGEGPASAGPVSAKRLRELFGTITIEGVGTGWYVGLAGFSPEAREYAQTRRLVLISGDGLREQLRVLTDRDLARALSRGK